MRQLSRWVTDGEILVAPLVALLLIFPTRAPALTGVGLVMLVGVWLVRWRVQGYPLSPTPLNLALLLLLLMVPIAVWASAIPDLTTEALAYLLAGVILFKAVAHWVCTPRQAWWVWGGLVAVGVTLAAVAPLVMNIPSSKLFTLPSLYTRWAGHFPENINANVMASALVILWPIALSGLTSLVSRLKFHILSIAAALSTLLLLATLTLTQSRGAYLGTVVSLLVLLGLRRPRMARVIVPLAVIAALVGGSLVGWDRVADELTAGDVTGGLDQRVEIWSRAVYAIQDFAFTGLGLGTFEQVVAVLYPLFLNPDGTVPHAHNLLLQVAVDLGLPGLVAYLALLSLTFVGGFSAYRAFQQQGQSALAGLCTGCIAGLVGMCVHGLVDVANWGIKLAFVPWAVMGLMVGLREVAEGQGIRANQETQAQNQG
ncbi:MAG: O-antigen ligase family protein [Chloroflexota bacterium]|nr:O-antigen ligase family protein [Chloroflexota bacterium]